MLKAVLFLIGTEPVLLVAIQFKLLLYGMRAWKEDILATTDKNLIIFSIDYDLVDQKVFWTDLGAKYSVDKHGHEEERDYGERFVPL